MASATRLRGVTPKTVWAGREPSNWYVPSLTLLSDGAFLSPSGPDLLQFELGSTHTRQARLISTQEPLLLYVRIMTLSPCGKFLAMDVRMTDQPDNIVELRIFHTANNFQDFPRPRPLQYIYQPSAAQPSTTAGLVSLPLQTPNGVSVFSQNSPAIQVISLAFSFQEPHLAVATNQPTVGVIIFNHIRETVLQTINTEGSIPVTVTFHPLDSWKIAVTGSESLVRFWRFTPKSVHAAPIVGLRKGRVTYTAQAWIAPYADTVIVVGSESGFVSVIQNCEQRAPAHHAFFAVRRGRGASNSPVTSRPMSETSERSVSPSNGMPTNPGECAVTQILVRGEHIVVSSPINRIVLYEVRKVQLSKASGLSATLVPLSAYHLVGIDRMFSLQFISKDSTTSFAMVAQTNSGVTMVDVICDQALGGFYETAAITGADIEPDENHGILGVNKTLPPVGRIPWLECELPRQIFQYHSSSIQSLAIATKGGQFLTSSYRDSSLRIWDLGGDMYNSCWLSHNFDKNDENPFHADFHPSGLQVACGTETEIREYAVSDQQLQLIRRFGVRTPFAGYSKSGVEGGHGSIPVIISQPVSKVCYSNGGQYLAVVTGKVAQIFHLYLNDSDSSIGHATQPSRIMVLSDHAAAITDLAFSRDDSQLITTAIDGAVYSWTMGTHSRTGEFVQKGVPATGLAISTHRSDSPPVVVVSFEVENENIGANTSQLVSFAAETVRRRRMTHAVPSRGNNSTSIPTSAVVEEEEEEDTLSKLMRAPIAERPVTPTPHRPRADGDGIIRPTRKQAYIAVWSDTDLTVAPKLIQMQSPVRSIALGSTPGPDSNDLCVLGMADGRILVSLLPIPMMLLSTQDISPTIRFESYSSAVNIQFSDNCEGTSIYTNRGGSGASVASQKSGRSLTSNSLGSRSTRLVASNTVSPIENCSVISTTAEEVPEGTVMRGGLGVHLKWGIDEHQCRVFRLLVGAVRRVLFDPNGRFILAAGEDGSMHQLSTQRPETQPTNSSGIEERSAAELVNTNTQFLMVERSVMLTLKQKLSELESSAERGRKEHEMYLSKLMELNDKKIAELETRSQTELSRRDKTIQQARADYVTLKRTMDGQITELQKRNADALAQMELYYEKLLSQEALYRDRLKQAYEETSVHSRMDIDDVKRALAQRLSEVEEEKERASVEMDKQKSIVLEYFEYVKTRHGEVLGSLEEQQTDERLRYKQQLDDITTKLNDAQLATMSAEVHATRTATKLRNTIELKEAALEKLTSDIDWANERIHRLENSLQIATNDLRSRAEQVEKWETKAMEMSKKAEDLERIRKTLTSQLALLNAEIEPKSRDQSKLREQLQEMSREYQLALQAMTEKDSTLSQRNESLTLLRKQLREERHNAVQHETTLKRAANLLDDFVRSLYDARLEGELITPLKEGTAAPVNRRDPFSALLTGIQLSKAVESRLRKLFEMLRPHLKDRELSGGTEDVDADAETEQKRQLAILQRGMKSLHGRLSTTEEAWSEKTKSHLQDNRTLLHEVNELRAEIRLLSMENQRLLANQDFNQVQQRKFSSFNPLREDPATESRESPPTFMGISNTSTSAITMDSPPPSVRVSTLAPDPPKPRTVTQSSSTDSFNKSKISLNRHQKDPSHKLSGTTSLPRLATSRNIHSENSLATLPDGSTIPQAIFNFLPNNSSTTDNSTTFNKSSTREQIANAKIAALIDLNLVDIRSGKSPF